MKKAPPTAEQRVCVLAGIREDEASSLQNLGPQPDDSNIAQTLLLLPRALYACVAPPPTQARTFTIVTRWRYLRQGWQPLSHTVFVTTKKRPPHVVVENRPGLFGATVDSQEQARP